MRISSLSLMAWIAVLFTSTAAPAWKEAYDPFTVRTLYLEINPQDWDRVRFDQPVEGQTESLERATALFHAEGEAPIQVEVRRKGETDPALPSESDPQKVSLKIDINALVPGQEWHGLRKMSLEIGGTAGPLNEGFAWQIHRLASEAGFYHMDAANAAWVKLYINGTYRGVFTSTEQRDEQMLRNRDLYSPYNTWLYKIDAGIFNEVGTGDSPAKSHLAFPPFTSSGSTPDVESDLPQWIDMESMLTFAACEAFVENTDGLFTHNGKNSFAADFLPPNLRRRIYLPWDMDAAIRTGDTDIHRTKAGKVIQTPYQALILNHPWFVRVYEHTFRELLADKLSTTSLNSLIDQLEPVLGPALDSDPYIGGGSAGQFASLRTWVNTRTANVANQLTLPHVARPAFNHPGGEVVSGFGLTMSAPAGQIYYTTNGSDPRATGGAVAAGALPYSGPIPIDRNTHIRARTLSGSNWSGLASEVFFQVAAYATPLRISEIMYHPLDPNPADAIDKDAYEFIELHNTGTNALNLSGFFFDGITHAFPDGTEIAAGARMVLVRNAAAFAARYPGVAYHGIYLGSLSNSGEKIRLKSADGTTVISVEYDDDPPWVISPDGMGYSLVNRNPDGNPDDAGNWRASSNSGGSPGSADPDPAVSADIVMSEVLGNAAAPHQDAVELLNTGNSSADISGWFLSNEARTLTGDLTPALLKKYRLPEGTILPAGGFAAFYEAAFSAGNPLVPFTLSPHGGRVYLSSADAAGNLTGRIVALEYPACDPNVSYGRVATSIGPQEAPLISPTFGGENSAPRIGPVVISEIMYNPLETDSEFVELHNVSTSPVDISGWDIDGIGGFAFPSGTVIAAGGFVVLVDLAKTTVETFRATFNVPAETLIFGHLFDLGNAGEALRLEKPNPDPLQSNILIERVRFNDKAPWPTEADGAGPSLERMPAGNFGNDPLSWKAVTIHGTPGRPGSSASGLAIARGSFWEVKAGPASLGSAWRESSYNATAWQTTTGPAGYGETFLTSVLTYGPDPAAKYPTTYFRKPFVVADAPANISSLILSVLHDDGIVVYLNGIEVARRGMAEGPVSYETLASGDIEATIYEDIDLSAFRHLLLQGINVLAVEVHQSAPASTDLVWDGGLAYTLAFDPDDNDGDDNDGDGLPHDWESTNGLDDSNPSDALADSDGDGQDNTTEYHAGTDPRSGSSFFQIDSTGRDPEGRFILRWSSIPGRVYRVSYSPDLLNWYSFGPAGDLTATGSTSEFIDPSLPTERRYYRISVVP